jgi:hypothetical protein
MTTTLALPILAIQPLDAVTLPSVATITMPAPTTFALLQLVAITPT